MRFIVSIKNSIGFFKSGIVFSISVTPCLAKWLAYRGPLDFFFFLINKNINKWKAPVEKQFSMTFLYVLG